MQEVVFELRDWWSSITYGMANFRVTAYNFVQGCITASNNKPVNNKRDHDVSSIWHKTGKINALSNVRDRSTWVQFANMIEDWPTDIDE